MRETEDEYCKNQPDTELELLTRKRTAADPLHQAALKELDRRKKIKEQKDKKYKKRIEVYSIIILILALLTLIVGIIQFFK